MFLTERQGGSDVGANTTRAVQDGEEWRLFGDKHFCSNVDADVFIVLARPDGAPDGQPGPRHLHRPQPAARRLTQRLRHQAPEAQAGHGRASPPARSPWTGPGPGWPARAGQRRPAGTAARQPPSHRRGDGRGINRMMEMVNGSRFGVALMGLGIHRRSFLEAAIYAARRAAVRATGSTATRSCARPWSTCWSTWRRAWPSPTSAPRPSGPPATPRRAGCCAGSWSRWPRCAAPGWPCGRPPTPSRSSGATATWRTGPWPASYATPSATPSGRGPRTSCASTSAGPCGASRPTWPCSPESSRPSTRPAATRCWPAPSTRVAAALSDAREAVDLPGGPTTTWPCCTAGGSPSCWPTPPKGALLVEEAAWALERDGDARKAAVARRFCRRAAGHAAAARASPTPTGSVLDLFEPLVRYGPIGVEDLAG